MNIKQIFASRLKELREAAQLSQSQLAERLRVSRGSISFYENGERTPDIVFLDSAASFFNVPIDYLLGYADNKIDEYVDMGLILGLSDEAIDKLKNAFYNKTILNAIIENENFEMLMEKAQRFLKEEYSDHEFSEYSLCKAFLHLMNSIEKKKLIFEAAKNKRDSVISLSNLTGMVSEHCRNEQSSSNIRIKNYATRYKNDMAIRNHQKGIDEE